MKEGTKQSTILRCLIIILNYSYLSINRQGWPVLLPISSLISKPTLEVSLHVTHEQGLETRYAYVWTKSDSLDTFASMRRTRSLPSHDLPVNPARIQVPIRCMHLTRNDRNHQLTPSSTTFRPGLSGDVPLEEWKAARAVGPMP